MIEERAAATPGALLALLACAAAALALVAWLLPSRRPPAPPDSTGLALAVSKCEELRALPPLAPELRVPDGATSWTYVDAPRAKAAFLARVAEPASWVREWTVEPLRLEGSALVAVSGGTPHDLARVTVRVRRAGAGGAPAPIVARIVALLPAAAE
jgi:hypothetical protein